MEQTDSKTGLCGTFLSPHDDPVGDFPYLTYDNVLLRYTFLIAGNQHFCCNNYNSSYQIAGIWEQYQQPEWEKQAKEQAHKLNEAINTHCIAPGPYGDQYVWSVDSNGNHFFEDQGAGSLRLLPFYQFCDSKDQVYLNTIKWIYSSHNNYFYEGTFGGAGSSHFQANEVVIQNY
jgi:meiotically up-regulated gene 157 (Mug157) protein